MSKQEKSVTQRLWCDVCKTYPARRTTKDKSKRRLALCNQCYFELRKREGRLPMKDTAMKERKKGGLAVARDTVGA